MTPLLLTKLFVPTVNLTLVDRPRLVSKLNEGFNRRLTLVAAPAGFGKTTLIAKWLTAHLATSVSWVSLGAADSIVHTFFSYLLTALQSEIPELNDTILSQLEANNDPDANVLVMQLINALVATKGRHILVLDDYHEIHNVEIHNALGLLLAHMPPQLHLIIITRADPPFPLARLRVRGWLTEIRSADLRFTPSETTYFLNERMQLGLNPAQTSQLAARTEGWIASLQLAALALRSTPQQRETFLNHFTGSDRYIMDYLISEVWDRQSEMTQTFLLQTAILDRLSAPLCNALRDATDSQTILQQLEAANLFLFPLDNERRWYRYHHLFVDLLRHRLREMTRASVILLHQRASDWLAAEGFVEEAIEHAFSAENHPQATELIAQHAHELFGIGRIRQVYQWVARLPDALLTSSPPIFLLQGLMLYRLGQFSAFAEHLGNVPDIKRFSSPEERGELYALQGYLAYLQGDFEKARQLCTKSLDRLATAARRMPTLALLGWCHEALGNLQTATDIHTRATALAEKAHSLTGTLAGNGKLAMLYADSAEWDRVAAQYKQVMAVAEARHGLTIPLIGLAHMAIGQWHQHKGDKSLASNCVEQGIALCKQWGGLWIDVLHGYVALLRILAQQNRHAEWQAKRAEAQAFATQTHMPAWAVSLLDAPAQTQLIDPLTQREQEVLLLLGEGLATPAIAKKMIVGVSTVRTHIKRIYAKLGVHSRTAALEKARILHLIP
ncbi:MAG: LuxR C-terminal-related transcriptional regulator [Candidatus Promineifilaceae bacterium]